MKYFIFAAVFLILFCITDRITGRIFLKQYTERLLLYCADSETLPADLLSATMPKSRIFTDLSLPIPSKDGEEINIGIVAVNRSGIYILCRINGEGVIENPNAPRWKHVFDGRCNEFDNPFRTQEGARSLIEYYTKNAGLPAVKAHSMLVYTGKNLRFTHPLSRSIVSADSLCERLSAMDRRGKLTYSEVRQACRLLSDIGSGGYM